MKQPLVSIITPCYNNENFIASTIRSVQAQTYRNWEMIIQDDGSTDECLAIVRSYASEDPRIIVSENADNKGAAVTRNEAIRKSRGEYLAFLDADDLWVPTKLEKQVRFMQENDCDFSFAMFEYIDEHGNSLLRQAKVVDRMPYWKMLLFDWAGCLTVMYKQDIHNKFYSDDIRQCNDYALFLRVVRKCKNVMGIHECLALYRIRKTGISKNKKTKYGSLKRVIHEFQGHPLPVVWVCVASRVFVKLFLQHKRIQPNQSKLKEILKWNDNQI